MASVSHHLFCHSSVTVSSRLTNDRISQRYSRYLIKKRLPVSDSRHPPIFYSLHPSLLKCLPAAWDQPQGRCIPKSPEPESGRSTELRPPQDVTHASRPLNGQPRCWSRSTLEPLELRELQTAQDSMRPAQSVLALLQRKPRMRLSRLRTRSHPAVPPWLLYKFEGEAG